MMYVRYTEYMALRDRVKELEKSLKGVIEYLEKSESAMIDPKSPPGIIARAADYIGHVPNCKDDDCLACDLRGLLDGEIYMYDANDEYVKRAARIYVRARDQANAIDNGNRPVSQALRDIAEGK